MRIRLEEQLNPVADDVLALVAVVQPILLGVLFSLKREFVVEIKGHQNLSLTSLSG